MGDVWQNQDKNDMFARLQMRFGLEFRHFFAQMRRMCYNGSMQDASCRQE